MKKFKSILALLLCAAMLASIFALDVFAASYEDGTFSGTATVGPDEKDSSWTAYDIEVNVTVSDGKITEVAYTDDSYDAIPEDSITYADKALDGNKRVTGLAAQIVDAQSTSVDSVSGATYSSTAIKEAVNAALKQAEVKEDNDDSDTDSETKQGTGRVQKFVYDLVVNVTMKGNQIADIEVANMDEVQDQNYQYCESAESGISKQLTSGTVTSVNDINVVSGATLSSNAIKQAVAEVTGEEFDLTAANGSLVMGKNGEVGLADSIKKAENFLSVKTLETDENGNYIKPEGKTTAYYTLWDLYQEAIKVVDDDTVSAYDKAILEAKVDDAVAALQKETGNSGGGSRGQKATYILMNIPYSDFYEAEGTEDVDAMTSATKVKTRTGNLVGGSYHVNSDGTDITGIIYPVSVTTEQLTKLRETYREITDEDSFSIETTNRGQTSTTTYEGREALFEAPSYSFYVLPTGETPSSYKKFNGFNGDALEFGAATGNVTTVALNEGDYDFYTDTTYGDYQLDLFTSTEESATAKPFSDDATIYGVLLKTKEEGTYGLIHLENIWRQTELAWSTGHTTSVHGCPVNYTPYESMEGQTLTDVIYYTSEGIYDFALEAYVAPYYDMTAAVDDLNTISVSGLPTDIQNAKATVSYSEGTGRQAKKVVIAEDVDVVDGKITLPEALLTEGKTYTVSVKSDNYATGTDTVADPYIRVAGEHRFTTAVAVADQLKTTLGVEKFDTIIIASGNDFPDALSGSYLSSKKNAPILLVDSISGTDTGKNSMELVENYISENLAEDGTVYILGGKTAVSESFEQGLTAAHVIRLAGEDRFETNLAILKEAGVDQNSDLLVTSGAQYADAVSASSTGKAILLVNPNTGLTDNQKEFINNISPDTTYILGGNTAVPTSVESSFTNVKRISGETRYETSLEIAKTFFSNPTTVTYAYGGEFPDALAAGALAYAMNAPIVLTSSDYGKEGAADYNKQAAPDKVYVFGGTARISDDAALTIVGVK